MLAAQQTAAASPLRPLALASAELYPDFVAELERETGVSVDYRQCGTIVLAGGRQTHFDDHCVDNRRLTAALIAAVRRRGIRLIENCAASAIAPQGGAWVVETAAAPLRARHIVIAAGAWSGSLLLPGTRPRKGQMLAIAAPPGLLRQVIVAPEVYLVPRADGRVLAGATVEDVGFDTKVDAAAIERLRAAAVQILPELARFPVAEAWAGLRPGTHDDLPYLGPLPAYPGIWAATGHFRDGILLTPITAQLIANLILGRSPGLEIAAFAPSRF